MEDAENVDISIGLDEIGDAKCPYSRIQTCLDECR
jgi:hypothetical protein